jgi:TonB family protein
MTSERELDFIDGISRNLVHRAAQRTPETLSERLEEEWLADMAERRGRFSRLRLAVGCYWATYTIAREHSVAAREQRVATVAAAGPRVAQVNFAGYVQENASLFSGRSATFLLVAFLHAAVLCGLAVGLSSKFPKVIPTRFEAFVIEKKLPPSVLPPPSKPDLSTPIVDRPPIDALPPIERPIERESPPTGDATDMTTEVPRGEVQSPPPKVNRVQGEPGKGFPNTADFYPSASIRLGEMGVAAVRACVDGNGRLTADPSIVQSSGKPRLDEAALKLARAGSGHYRATTEDGKPVSSCYAFGIRFDLRN